MVALRGACVPCFCFEPYVILKSVGDRQSDVSRLAERRGVLPDTPLNDGFTTYRTALFQTPVFIRLVEHSICGVLL